jgi:hypothetical protein
MNTVFTNTYMVRYIGTFLTPTDQAVIHTTSRVVREAIGTLLPYHLNICISGSDSKNLQLLQHIPRHQVSVRIIETCYRPDMINISTLGDVHTLDLSDCQQITDVSALNKVHTLHLSLCQQITDVSALGSLHILHLSFCQQITDVSALNKVHSLNLSCCCQITDVSALGKVHTLNLSNCKNVSDVSALGGVAYTECT